MIMRRGLSASCRSDLQVAISLCDFDERTRGARCSAYNVGGDDA